MPEFALLTMHFCRSDTEDPGNDRNAINESDFSSISFRNCLVKGGIESNSLNSTEHL